MTRKESGKPQSLGKALIKISEGSSKETCAVGMSALLLLEDKSNVVCYYCTKIKWVTKQGEEPKFEASVNDSTVFYKFPINLLFCEPKDQDMHMLKKLILRNLHNLRINRRVF